MSSSSIKSSKSSSSVFLSSDSHEKSSNSTEQKSSSSSNNKASSSSAKSSSSNKVSSSSEQKSKSSSSVKTSSSSEKEISSSGTKVSPCKKDEEDKCEYGTLIDSRDGKKYKTVTIGTQIWMAENLNYASENSFCYKGLAENCIKYGRLYSWATSMDSAHVWSSNGQNCGYKTTCSPTYPVQGICPTDWHLPNFAEWNTLLNSIGGNANAGKMLKSTSGWKILSNWYEGGNGTNAYGFSALPAGSKFSKEGYNDEGSNARFWSSTEYDDEKYRSNDAYYLELNYLLDKAKLTNSEKKFGHSVRCIKNKFTTNSIKSSSSIAESNSSGKPSSSSKMSELISFVSSAQFQNIN